MKEFVFQLLESTPLSSRWFQIRNLHPYNEGFLHCYDKQGNIILINATEMQPGRRVEMGWRSDLVEVLCSENEDERNFSQTLSYLEHCPLLAPLVGHAALWFDEEGAGRLSS